MYTAVSSVLILTPVDGIIVMFPDRLGVPLLPAVTVTAQNAVLPPSAVVTITAAVPSATAVTTPFVTTAFVASLVDHDTALFVALSGATVAVRVAEFPAVRLRLF